MSLPFSCLIIWTSMSPKNQDFKGIGGENERAVLDWLLEENMNGRVLSRHFEVDQTSTTVFNQAVRRLSPRLRRQPRKISPCLLIPDKEDQLIYQLLLNVETDNI